MKTSSFALFRRPLLLATLSSAAAMTPRAAVVDSEHPSIESCGSGARNSPVVDGAMVGGRAFHELELPHAARAGARARVLSGAGLVGTVLALADARGRRYEVRVGARGTTHYWAGAPDAVDTYALTWTGDGQPAPQPVCTAGPNEAILFTGDRVDARTKTVTADDGTAGARMNVACAGTALFKLHLTRHTEASQGRGVTNDRAQRQAMLKMLTGDVCGTGQTFTRPGQPLAWTDAKGLGALPDNVEAVWNEHGAVCLSGFRLPENEPAIAAACPGLPPCTASALGSGHLVSSRRR